MGHLTRAMIMDDVDPVKIVQQALTAFQEVRRGSGHKPPLGVPNCFDSLADVFPKIEQRARDFCKGESDTALQNALSDTINRTKTEEQLYLRAAEALLTMVRLADKPSSASSVEEKAKQVVDFMDDYKRGGVERE